MIASREMKELLNNEKDLRDLYKATTTKGVLTILKRYSYIGDIKKLEKDILEMPEPSSFKLDEVGAKVYF